MAAIDTLLFLTFRPLADFEKKRYDFDRIRERGFEIRILNISNIIHARISLGVTSDSESVIVTDRAAFQEYLFAHRDRAILIDCIAHLVDYDLDNEFLYRIIKKINIRYVIVYPGGLPYEQKSFFKRMLWRMRVLFHLRQWLIFFSRRVTRILRRHTSLYPRPEVVFSSNTQIIADYVKRVGRRGERMIPIGSFDYDLYLEQKRNFEKVPPQPYCVYLDEAATHHPEYALTDNDPLDAKDYYPVMNAFFDRIENEMGVHVIIAAHPRASYDRFPGVFGTRQILKGRTANLVSSARFVIAHASTSVSLAVICKKPVILVGFRAYDRNLMGSLPPQLARHLGTRVLRIDRPYTLSDIKKLSMQYDVQHYKDYLSTYITYPGNTKRMVDIILDTFDAMV